MQIIIPFLKITESERETLVADPREFCNLIEDACGDQKSTTVKVLTAKLLSSLSENITGFYSQMMTFCMDAIARSLKDQIPTNQSFTANSTDDQMADTFNNAATNPETTSVTFSDPDLEQVIQKFNLRFSSAEELIEVCLVSMTATSHLLASQRDTHSTFDIFMSQNVDKLLQDKNQAVLVR